MLILSGIIVHQGAAICWKAFNIMLLKFGTIKGPSARKLREELAWVKLEIRRKIHKLSFLYKCVNGMTPSYISDLVPLI